MARRRREKVDVTAGGLRALGYGRVSTSVQVEGTSLESQAQTIEGECRRRGWVLLEVIDEDVSGKSLRRPGVQRALRMLSSGDADVLVVAKLDRLSRSLLDYATVVERAAREGWHLVVLDAPVGTDTAYGEAMLGIMAVFAQLERRLISERTRDGLAARRAQGMRLGRESSLPSSVVERIRRRRREGASLARIAGELNADGVATGQGGKRWYGSTVRAVLESEQRG